MGAACTHRRTKPQLRFICHSETKQHGCELDLGLACIMHSSLCVQSWALKRGRGPDLLRRRDIGDLQHWDPGLLLTSMAFVSCFSLDRIWPCSREIRSLALLVIKQYCRYVSMNTHRRAPTSTHSITRRRKKDNWASVKVCGCEVKLRLINALCSAARTVR